MLRELKTFMAVAEYGTFSSAGARVGLTQSAVSAQMHRLEEELGVTLFDRTGRMPRLTAAGQEALGLAGELMAVYARLLKQPSIAENTGTLRVGAISSVQESVLAGPVVSFRQLFPAWRVRIVTGGALNLLGQVDSGDLDMAVIGRPSFTLPNGLEWCGLAFEPFVLLVPDTLAGQPWRYALCEAPFIRYDRGSFGGQLVDQFLSRACLDVHDAVELIDLHGIAQMVASGAGVALVPRTVARAAWPTGVSALELGEDTFYREIGMVQKPRQNRHLAAQKFAEEMIKVWRPEPDPSSQN
ncbi:LysR family transcriptional regulator [Paraburkholderia fungorum]|jgi:DNA-binding transcriptional LysR family regulator|uniref:LysR family transcriptional regulator n=1 Tax=Paraburkholderia fungorum TaxID=134537 RepID=UPI0038B9A03F